MREILNSKAGTGEPRTYNDFVHAAKIRRWQMANISTLWEEYEKTGDTVLLRELANQTRDRLRNDLTMHKALHTQLDVMIERVKDMDVEFGQQARKDIQATRNTLIHRGNEETIQKLHERLDSVINGGRGTPQQEAFRNLIPHSLGVMGASMGTGVAADHWLARIEELKKAWDFLCSQQLDTSSDRGEAYLINAKNQP